jgi:hypothetical protein
MRTRAFVLAALLVLPAALAAQRMPRVTRRTPAEPVPLPPEVEPVARAVALKRSHWSAEGYGLISSIEVPAIGQGPTSYTVYGAGTRGDYRFTNHLSATVDMTASSLGAPSTVYTAEVGSRYMPLELSDKVRPYFDLHAGYIHMSDSYSSPVGPGDAVAGVNQGYSNIDRYSRGFGVIGGGGLEMSITNSFAVTTGVSALRTRMTVYRLSGATNLPAGSNYWMTSTRLLVGFKYNPVSVLHMSQNPRQ